LFVAYLVLSIVAGYGWDKEKSEPSERWTLIGLVASAVAFLALELYTHHRETGRWFSRPIRSRRSRSGRDGPNA
jgi:hypothetical protein